MHIPVNIFEVFTRYSFIGRALAFSPGAVVFAMPCSGPNNAHNSKSSHGTKLSSPMRAPGTEVRQHLGGHCRHSVQPVSTRDLAGCTRARSAFQSHFLVALSTGHVDDGDLVRGRFVHEGKGAFHPVAQTALCDQDSTTEPSLRWGCVLCGSSCQGQ